MIGREAIESTEQMEQKAKRQRGNPCGQERAPHVRKLTSIQHRGAARGWMRLIGRAYRPPSLHRLLRLFMNFTILTLFFPPFPPSFPLRSPSSPPRQASGPPSHMSTTPSINTPLRSAPTAAEYFNKVLLICPSR